MRLALLPLICLAGTVLHGSAPATVRIHNGTPVTLQVGRPSGLDPSPILVQADSEGPDPPIHRLGVAHVQGGPDPGCLDVFLLQAGDTATFQFERQDANRYSELIFLEGDGHPRKARAIIRLRQTYQPATRPGEPAQVSSRVSVPRGPLPSMEVMPNQHVRKLSEGELEILRP
jgi:hypothetical protein